VAESFRDLRRLPNYGDVIEAVETESYKLRFIRDVKRGRFRQFMFFASESPELTVVRAASESVVVVLPPLARSLISGGAVCASA
jgi:hypothetical protein